MKTFKELNEEMVSEETLYEEYLDELLNEGTLNNTFKSAALYFRMKQNTYMNRIKGEKRLEKKIDLLSEQMVSQSSLVLLTMVAGIEDIKSLKGLVKKN